MIRESYEAVISADFNVATASDVLYSLWRLHYKRIEEFRAEIRKLRSLAAKQQQQQQPRGVPHLQGRLSSSDGLRTSEALERQLALFRGFLSEASGFFHNLVGKIKSLHGLPYDYAFPDPPPRASTGATEQQLAACRLGCQQCLVYLGDLARYRELVDDGATSGPRDWSVAAGYYLQASIMLPTHGNPHNQVRGFCQRGRLSQDVNALMAVLSRACSNLTLRTDSTVLGF